MATMEDTAAATKTLSEDPETKMGGSGSKPKENGSRSSDVGKDDGGSSDNELVFETEEVEKDKIDLEILNSVSCGSAHYNGNVRDGDLSIDLNGNEKGEKDSGNSNNQDCVFRVGDLVWGKIRSHPWWPAQICDPKDASEFAMEIKQEGRFLVAFFGDGSCSWCSPSQLVPFVDNFTEMAIHSSSSSRSFHTAVKSAVDEVSRLVELEMTCNCAPVEEKTCLARPVVENSGLKEGVVMPKVDFHRLSIPKYEPEKLLEKVKHLAKVAYVENALDLGVSKSWLASYYCYKGGYGYPLTEYQEPLYIEGLEDKAKNVGDVVSDFSVPIEVPIMGPRDDDGLSSSSNKNVRKRKQKSVAELMGENKNTMPEETQKRSSQKRKKKNDPENGEASLVGKPKEIEVARVENTSGEGKEEESEGVTSPRERKKSKYLSPPYTNPTWRIGNSSFKTESVKTESVKTESVKTESAVENNDKITKIPPAEAKMPPAETTVKNLSTVDKSLEKKLTNGKLEKPDVSVDTTPKTIIKSDEKMTFSVSDVDAPVSELLSEIQLAAVDHLHLSKEGSLDMVWAFVSALRSSIYLQGSDYKLFRKCKTGGKRKSRISQLGDVGDDIVKKKAKPSKEMKRDTLQVADDGPPQDCLIGDVGDDIIKKKAKQSKETKGDTLQVADDGPPQDCLISNVRVVRQKLEIMTAIMANYYSKFSAEDKDSLKNEVKELMEKVETVSEKVRVMAEKTSS